MAAHIRRAAGLLSAFLLAVAAPASADPTFAEIETSEGTITIELFDFPDVVAYASYFVDVARNRTTNGVFHRGDKVRFCDATYCFYCLCTAGLVCQNDPNQRTCDTPGDEFWIVDDQTHPAAYLQTGRFFLDGLYELDELSAMPATATGFPTYSNAAYTVAFVRVDDPVLGPTLTSEWIINVEDNPELDDPFGNDPVNFSEAYFVFGRVVLGQDVVNEIAGMKTYDATQDATVDPMLSTGELEQVPVFDSFSGEPGGDPFLDPCAPADTACLNPLCVDPTPDQLACADPRCVALIPLSEEEQEMVDMGVEVDRYCATPALGNFPIIVPEPGAVGLAAGLAALAGLAARRRRAASP